MSIPSKTSDRQVKIFFSVFVDLGGKKHVNLIRGNTHSIAIRDDYSHYTWMNFISDRSDAADTFAKYLSDLRVEEIPSEVVMVRSDDRGEFSEGKFGKLGKEMNIKQELTTADILEYNGVAERRLA